MAGTSRPASPPLILPPTQAREPAGSKSVVVIPTCQSRSGRVKAFKRPSRPTLDRLVTTGVPAIAADEESTRSRSSRGFASGKESNHRPPDSARPVAGRKSGSPPPTSIRNPPSKTPPASGRKSTAKACSSPGASGRGRAPGPETRKPGSDPATGTIAVTCRGPAQPFRTVAGRSGAPQARAGSTARSGRAVKSRSGGSSSRQDGPATARSGSSSRGMEGFDTQTPAVARASRVSPSPRAP